jgi:hypothetical protein
MKRKIAYLLLILILSFEIINSLITNGFWLTLASFVVALGLACLIAWLLGGEKEVINEQ